MFNKEERKERRRRGGGYGKRKGERGRLGIQVLRLKMAESFDNPKEGFFFEKLFKILILWLR